MQKRITTAKIENVMKCKEFQLRIDETELKRSDLNHTTNCSNIFQQKYFLMYNTCSLSLFRSLFSSHSHFYFAHVRIQIRILCGWFACNVICRRVNLPLLRLIFRLRFCCKYCRKKNNRHTQQSTIHRQRFWKIRHVANSKIECKTSKDDDQNVKKYRKRQRTNERNGEKKNQTASWL